MRHRLRNNTVSNFRNPFNRAKLIERILAVMAFSLIFYVVLKIH